jgi:hypothetical protein
MCSNGLLLIRQWTLVSKMVRNILVTEVTVRFTRMGIESGWNALKCTNFGFTVRENTVELGSVKEYQKYKPRVTLNWGARIHTYRERENKVLRGSFYWFMEFSSCVTSKHRSVMPWHGFHFPKQGLFFCCFNCSDENVASSFQVFLV